MLLGLSPWLYGQLEKNREISPSTLRLKIFFILPYFRFHEIVIFPLRSYVKFYEKSSGKTNLTIYCDTTIISKIFFIREEYEFKKM